MPSQSQASPGSAFDLWLDDFLVHLFRRRPVDATFAGLGQYSDFLPDMSREGLATTLQEIHLLLEKLGGIRPESLDTYRRIDYDLAKGFLEMQAWERTEGGVFDRNPVSYTSEAAFALMSLFLSDTRPIGQRAASLAARLRAIPAFFRNARANLLAAPALWIDRAIDECKGGLNFLSLGIPILVEDEGLVVDQGLVDAAILAFREFSDYLDTELRGKPGAEYACGKKAFKEILGWAHEADIDPIEYARHAERVIDECDAELVRSCAELGVSSPEEVLGNLALVHPDESSYLAEYGAQWERLRALNEAEQLVTWPDFPLEYQEIPRWAREAQPHLYFLYYRCPPRYARPSTYRYNVTPIDPALPAEKREALLKGNNTYVIKTNHVLHHGGIGHHAQNWHALGSKSRIGQVSCTDGASRLLMLCSGTLCEGWACYITSLAGSRGFLSPLEELAERSSLRRMAARAVVDARLHCQVYSTEDAIRFYRERAKMSESFARSEVVKNSLFPGGAIMYLLGVEGIEALKREFMSRKGADFNLKGFHDEFLSYGGVPVERIAKEMKAGLR